MILWLWAAFVVLILFLLACFVGVEMMLAHHFPIPTPASLAVIVGILGVGIAASVVGRARDTARLASPIENELESLVVLTWRRARKTLVLVTGSTLLGVGALMLVLPGPGLVVIAFGLAVLATEFYWAKRWLARLRVRLDDVRGNVQVLVHKASNRSD